MLRLVVAGLRTRLLRSVLMAATVALGVGILGGSFVYADTASRAFYNDFARAAVGVDVWVQPDDEHWTPATVERVAAVPGVAHADTRVTGRLGLIGRNGRVLTNGADIGLAISVPAWDGFTPYHLVAGRHPASPEEVAVDIFTAAREDLALGDRVQVLTRDDETRRYVVVGLVDLGASPQFTDRSVLVMQSTEIYAYAILDESPIIVAAAEQGVDERTLRDRVAVALGDGHVVHTGTEIRQDLSVQAAKYVTSFVATLRASSVVALSVAVLIVYNTFQITVTSRRRELALLRCVGAKSGQLVRFVLIESALIGVAAAVLATAASIVAGLLLALGQDVFGSGIPAFSLVLSARSVAIPVIVGVTATIASGVLPALAAGRLSPLAALRDAQTGTDGQRGNVTRMLVVPASVGLALVGVALMGTGRDRGFDGLVALVGGAMLVLAAVVLVLPLVVTELSAPLRWLVGRIGVSGRLAVDNARRHPVRFAAATAAVLASVAPMSAFAVLLSTAQDQGARELAQNFPVDFVVWKTGAKDSQLPAEVVANVRAAPEFGVVALSRVGRTFVDGGEVALATMEPAVLGSDLALEIRAGDLGGLGSGTIAITQRMAVRHGLQLGDAVMVGPPGARHSFRLVAVYDDAPIDADALINWTDFSRSGVPGSELLLVRRSEGATAAAAAAALDRAIATDPGIAVLSVAERRESLVAGLQKRLTHYNVLIGFAMIIAVLGIAGTLSLSVVERTRESALLRSVGLSRRQVYATVLAEAVLTAGIGALAGAAFGVGFGYVAARELIDFYGHGAPVVPVGTVATYIAAAIAAAAVASLLPARRVVRTSVIAAMSLDR